MYLRNRQTNIKLSYTRLRLVLIWNGEATVGNLCCPCSECE